MSLIDQKITECKEVIDFCTRISEDPTELFNNQRKSNARRRWYDYREFLVVLEELKAEM